MVVRLAKFFYPKKDKQMKTMLVAVLLMASISHGAGREEAYNGICKTMSFDSNKNSCMEKLKEFRYFSEGAISICTSLSFDSGKISCVTAIGDKRYENYELSSCAGQSFDSSKLKCLTDNGRKIGQSESCVSNKELLNRLYRTQDALRSGDSRSADEYLSDLILALRSCHKG